MDFGQFPHPLGRDVAGDHEDGIVRGIVALVERQRVVEGKLLDLVTPADHRHAVGMVQVERCPDLFLEQRTRRIVGARTALLQHDIALGTDVVLGDDHVDHAVGLHLHHHLQAVGGDLLVISGDVIRGESVVLPAIGGDDLGERAIGDLVGALEHQMLEEMGDARDAARLIGRTDAVPDHMGDHRRPVVLDHHDVHPVVERERRDRLFGMGQWRPEQSDCSEKAKRGVLHPAFSQRTWQ